MRDQASNDQAEGLGRKLRALLSERGAIGSINHIRMVALHRIHERINPSPALGFEAVPTSDKVELSELTIDSDNKGSGVHYAPTPRLIFKWLHKLISTNLDDTAFIDVGAGRGRIVMMAMEHPYARVIGCEFAQELAEQAERNIASHPQNSIKARSVEIVHGDATEMNIPDMPCIFFLFNPFGADVLQKFLDNALNSYADNPRAMTFIYVNPAEEWVFENSKVLVEKRMPAATKAKMALLSPYSARIFVTPEAQ